MQPPTRINIHSDGTRRAVHFSAQQINQLATAQEITLEIIQLLDEYYGTAANSSDSAARELTIDLSRQESISSVALTELINIRRHAQLRGVRIVLANVVDVVKEVFVLTRLERTFDFVSEERSASDIDESDSVVV